MSHLRYIKWLLGVHKKTSNVGAWGDSGKPPILLDMTRQILEYYKRAESAASDTFIHHAFKEQVAMNLDWYSLLSSLISEFSNDVSQEPFNSENIVSNMVSTFVQIWKAASLNPLGNCHSTEHSKRTSAPRSTLTLVTYLKEEL